MFESLRLQNFKSFRDATLPLGPFTVIVGTNASGKSNLRDAFRFLHGVGRGYSIPEIFDEKYADGALVWSGIRGGMTGAVFVGDQMTNISATANGVRRMHLRHSLKLKGPTSFGDLRILEERLDADSDLIFETTPERALGRLPKQVVQIRNDPPDAGTRRIELEWDRPALGQIGVRLDWWPQDALRHVREVRDAYTSIRFLEFSPDALRRPSSPGNSVLGDRGENLSSVLKAICDEPHLKQSLTGWLEELTPLDVVDLEFPSDLQGRILVTLVEQSGRKTPATSASDGTLRFLGLLAALLHPEPAACYFLEEFDTGIHPSRLYLLVQLIEQETARSGIQVIATTHSPQVLEMLNDKSREDAVLVYRQPHSDHSQIKRIMDIPTAREVLKTAPLGELHQTGWLENTVYFAEPEAEHEIEPETAS